MAPRERGTDCDRDETEYLSGSEFHAQSLSLSNA
jgi:hypothetical protein